MSGKVIHWELCKRFDHSTKLYMHKPKAILENRTHKILLISEKRLGLALINKKKSCYLVDFVVPVDPRGKIEESEKRDKYLDIAWE